MMDSGYDIIFSILPNFILVAGITYNARIKLS